MWKLLNACVVLSVLAVSFPGRLSADELRPSPWAVSSASLDLPKLLAGLGFEPRDVSPARNGSAYEIRNLRGDREVAMVVSVSSDGRYLEISSEMHDRGALSKEAAAAYLRLLEINRDIAPNYFAIRNDRLLLLRKVETAGLTPAAARKAFDQLDGSVRSTVEAASAPEFKSGSSGADVATQSTDSQTEDVLRHFRPNPFAN